MNKRSFSRYIYAILAIPVIILMRYALMPLIGPGVPYVTLFPVSVVVALLAGMGPAIMTGILGSIAIDYLFIEPLYALEFNIPGISRMIVVVLTSAFVGYVGDILRAARAKAEQQAIELRESQERLHLAQQAANAGTWEWDLTTNKLNWSPELYRLFGLDPTQDNASFDVWRSVLHPEDIKGAETRVEQAIKNRTPLTNEYRIVLPNGETRWINALGNTVYDEDGPLTMSGICLDIAERKKKEEELYKLNRTLRAISNSDQVMMHAKDESQYLQEVCDIIIKDCGHAMVWVGFAEDDEGKTVRPVANAGFEKGYLETLKITWADTERGQGPTGTAIRAGKTCFCRNMLTDPAFEPWRHEAIKRGYASSIALPLISDGKTFGALTIYSREPDPFSNDEVNLLTELASDLSYGIAAIRLRIARDKAEALLRQSEAKYRELVQNANSVIIRWKYDGTLIFFNEYAQKLFGYSDDEVIGRNVDILLPEKESTGGDLSKLIQNIAAKPESYVNNINENVCRDGRRIWFAWTNKPILDEHGRVAEILAVGIDITDRKRAEEELRKAHDELEIRVKERTADLDEAVSDLQKQVQQRIKAEETVKTERKRFENVLEMMPAYAILLTPDYHVAYANRTFREWFGDDNGKKCYEFLFNRKEPCENCQTYNVMKTGKSQFWEWTGPNGHHYDIYDYPFTDTDGSPLIMEIGVDVTAHKQTQTALRSTSLYARGLLEASLDPLVTISPEGKITDINRATELVTGLSREDLIDSDFSDYFTEPQKAKDGYKKVLAEGMVKDYPLTIRHTSGHTTDVMYNATLYKNEAGQVQGVFAAARDVTEHNRIEKRVQITNVLLELFAQKSTRKDYLDSVVNAIRDWSGCQCIGIRLANSDGLIPYESQIGFTNEFLAAEGVLSLKTDTCACMRVITQTPEPQDARVMTSKGSFRCDNTLEFFNALPEKNKARYRGHCIRHGFASLAVVPIRYRAKVLGAIHLADKKENKTQAQAVEFIENMAMLIGEAVHRFDIETELRESEERYRQLVELSPEGIGVERDDKIVFMNTAAARLLGVKNSAELIGKPILDFVYPDYRKRTHMQLEFLRRKRKALPLRENIFMRVDGTPIDVEVAATPLFYENRLAAQIVFRDITERKLAHERIIANQKQLRLLTAELLLTEEHERHEIATALHDSLGPILAFSKRELGILQKSAPPQLVESLKNISNNISEAVNQTRTLTFDLSPPTLYTLGFEIAIEELLERFCQEHKLEYSFRNSDASKPLTDPVKVLLYRSVRETLINIAKHARAKLVKVVLSRADNDIEITIEDDGKGFDKSTLSEKPKGLGLFSVRERLRHIGGKLEIESKRDKGTHITLTAPLKIE